VNKPKADGFAAFDPRVGRDGRVVRLWAVRRCEKMEKVNDECGNQSASHMAIIKSGRSMKCSNVFALYPIIYTRPPKR
jgi:hypothetical protein